MMVLLWNLCCRFYNRYFFRYATITSLPVLIEMVFIQQKFPMPCKSAKLSKLPRHTPEMQTAHALKLASAQSSLTVTTKSSKSSHKTVDCPETILFSHVEKHFQTSFVMVTYKSRKIQAARADDFLQTQPPQMGQNQRKLLSLAGKENVTGIKYIIVF